MSDRDILEVLGRAIYGRVELDEAELVQCCEQLDWSFPARITAVYLPDDRLDPRLAAAGRALHLHPGLAYLVTPLGRALDLPARILRGEPQDCARVSDLLSITRRAIISLRHREMAAWQQGGPAPDAAFETQLRALALQQLRARSREGRESLGLWLSVVVRRHQVKIDTVRRKLIEFLAQLSQDSDQGFAVSTVFCRAVETLCARYAMSELSACFPPLAEELAEALILHEFTHSETIRDPLVRHAVGLMAREPQHATSPASVAAAVGCSQGHLARQFRRATGRSLGEHLQQLRVQRARELLVAEPESALIAIAESSGFGSLEQFHRVFKRITGLTPHRWRVLHR